MYGGWGALLVGAAVIGLMPADAQTTPTTPAVTTSATTTVQQDFEAATAFDTKGDSAGALAAWQRLEARTKPGSRSRGIVLLRKSATLVKLSRLDEAVEAARAGLAILPATDPTLAEDRWQAFATLGAVAARTLDYAGAGEAYQAAEKAGSTPAMRLSAILAYVEVATFTDPAAAVAALARADAIVAAGNFDKGSRALLARRHALLAMNRGDYEDARKQGIAAVDLYGGLNTAKIDLNDVSARSDVAIAALLAGKADDARRYMAMTGAGRLSKGEFDPAVQMKVPDCGGEAGLKPADMAVVEFSIADSGAILSVVPVYAAGGGAVALEFARAVKDWSWTPEQVKALPTFFRFHARVELRCSTAFERPSIAEGLEASFRSWMESKGHAVPSESHGADAAALAGQRARLAAIDAKGGATAVEALVPLSQLVANSVVGREEKNALYTRALAIAQANAAPPSARLMFDVGVRTTANADQYDPAIYRRAMTPLLSAAPYATDAQSRAALRLLLADKEGPKRPDRSRALLDQVVSDAGLAANDPLRVAALIRIASINQAAGKTDAARMAFEKSGLSASQCAILDSPPKLVTAGGTFPEEAVMWGFEGWTRMQFDVGADGRALNERVVMSYPPFVFTKAGTEAISTSRWSKTYRPDGGAGCGGLERGIRFIMPG